MNLLSRVQSVASLLQDCLGGEGGIVCSYIFFELAHCWICSPFMYRPWQVSVYDQDSPCLNSLESFFFWTENKSGNVSMNLCIIVILYAVHYGYFGWECPKKSLDFLDFFGFVCWFWVYLVIQVIFKRTWYNKFVHGSTVLYPAAFIACCFLDLVSVLIVSPVDSWVYSRKERNRKKCFWRWL